MTRHGSPLLASVGLCALACLGGPARSQAFEISVSFDPDVLRSWSAPSLPEEYLQYLLTPIEAPRVVLDMGPIGWIEYVAGPDPAFVTDMRQAIQVAWGLLPAGVRAELGRQRFVLALEPPEPSMAGLTWTDTGIIELFQAGDHGLLDDHGAMVNTVLHELGHAYDVALGFAPSRDPEFRWLAISEGLVAYFGGTSLEAFAEIFAETFRRAAAGACQDPRVWGYGGGSVNAPKTCEYVRQKHLPGLAPSPVPSPPAGIDVSVQVDIGPIDLGGLNLSFSDLVGVSVFDGFSLLSPSITIIDLGSISGM